MEMRMRKSGNGEMRKWKHTCDDPWIIIIMAELDRQSWRIGFILSQLVVWPARLLTWLASKFYRESTAWKLSTRILRPVVSVFPSLSFFIESPLPLAFPGRLCATGASSIVR